MDPKRVRPLKVSQGRHGPPKLALAHAELRLEAERLKKTSRISPSLTAAIGGESESANEARTGVEDINEARRGTSREKPAAAGEELDPELRNSPRGPSSLTLEEAVSDPSAHVAGALVINDVLSVAASAVRSLRHVDTLGRVVRKLTNRGRRNKNAAFSKEALLPDQALGEEPAATQPLPPAQPLPSEPPERVHVPEPTKEPPLAPEAPSALEQESAAEPQAQEEQCFPSKHPPPGSEPPLSPPPISPKASKLAHRSKLWEESEVHALSNSATQSGKKAHREMLPPGAKDAPRETNLTRREPDQTPIDPKKLAAQLFNQEAEGLRLLEAYQRKRLQLLPWDQGWEAATGSKQRTAATAAAQTATSAQEDQRKDSLSLPASERERFEEPQPVKLEVSPTKSWSEIGGGTSSTMPPLKIEVLGPEDSSETAFGDEPLPVEAGELRWRKYGSASEEEDDQRLLQALAAKLYVSQLTVSKHHIIDRFWPQRDVRLEGSERLFPVRGSYEYEWDGRREDKQAPEAMEGFLDLCRQNDCDVACRKLDKSDVGTSWVFSDGGGLFYVRCKTDFVLELANGCEVHVELKKNFNPAAARQVAGEAFALGSSTRRGPVMVIGTDFRSGGVVAFCDPSQPYRPVVYLDSLDCFYPFCFAVMAALGGRGWDAAYGFLCEAKAV